MASGMQMRHSNDIDALTWTEKFVWLRSRELGLLMWPDDPYSRTRGDRVVRGLLDRQLVIERQLPQGAGRAVVLSEGGAQLLREEGMPDAKSGKNWGKTVNNRWQPTAAWKHDLITAGVLVRLANSNYSIFPERLIRRDNPSLIKIPDGLAEQSGYVLWIEVEKRRKSGDPMKKLADACCLVVQQAEPMICGMRPTNLLVAYVKDSTDERRMSLDHRSRVTAAIHKSATMEIPILWAECELAGHGVEKITFIEERIPPKKAEPPLTTEVRNILNALDKVGWVKNEGGRLVSHYQEFIARVWFNQPDGWAFEVQSGPRQQHADHSESCADAKIGCAVVIAGRVRYESMYATT